MKTKNKALNIIVALLTILVLISGCKKSPTEPDKPNPDNNLPGKRAFSWSVDSIAYDSTIVGSIETTSMWGSSADDIWAAGFTTDVRNCLLHYNGKIWERAVYGTPITEGGTGSRQVGYVWGGSKGDVWAIGGRIFSSSDKTAPFVMHYDGVKWTEDTKDNANLPIGGFDIAGVSKDEFYVACIGYIVHFKNGIWKRYSLENSFIINRISYYNGSLYLIAYGIEMAPILYRFNSEKFEKIDETKENGKFELGGIWICKNKLYTSWYKIKFNDITNDGKLNPDTWQTINLPVSSYSSRSYNAGEKNFFVIGYPSLVYHYNGTDWANIDIVINGRKIEDANFTSLWTDGSTIVLVDSDHNKIYRGN